MPTNEEIEAMKYEALATLITTQHEETKRRQNAFEKFIDFRFKGLETHNKNQNGSITRAINKIEALEKESQRRGLTCMKTVDVLENEAKKVKQEGKEAVKEKKSKTLSKRQWVTLFIVYAIMTLVSIGGFVITLINQVS